MTVALGVQIAATFIWLGMVVAISFLEAPLKFRAPGITVELGVGIGRMVFRALNIAEALLWLAIVVAMLFSAGDASQAHIVLIVAAGADLALGAVLVRPLMDRKVRAEGPGSRAPRTALHVSYIALELLKVGVLVALGIALLTVIGAAA